MAAKSPKVTEYHMVEEESADQLTTAVNRCLEDGWDVLGNPIVGRDGYLYQAVVKYEETASAEINVNVSSAVPDMNKKAGKH